MRKLIIANLQNHYIILIACFILFLGCGSTQQTGTISTTLPVILDGRVLYVDTTIVDDQILNVKLDPGPDTLRVGSGYFNIGVFMVGRYSLRIIPENRKFNVPPASIMLNDGLNIYDFWLPRHKEGDMPPRDLGPPDSIIVSPRPPILVK